MAAQDDIFTTLAPLVNNRCYPLIAPANVTKPYIVYQMITSLPMVTMDGATGLENKRLQIDGYATTYDGVKTLEESVKTAMAAASFISVPLMTGDLYEPETQLFRSLMDYSLWI